MSASAGRVLLIPKGEYDSATEYHMLDLVTYLGSSYVCKATTTGNDPTNTTYWQLQSAGKENVSDMDDVDLTSVADGEELSYDETAGKWKNTSRLLSLESVADISAASKVIDFSSIISITDALPIPAKDVKLKVEPVQDLHGYDKPWVGGAGDNKLDHSATTQTYTAGGANLVCTVYDDGTINLNGSTGSAQINIMLLNSEVPADKAKIKSLVDLGASLKMSGCPSVEPQDAYRLSWWMYNGQSVSIRDTGSGVTFTPTNYETGNIAINVAPNITVSNKLFKPMITLASVADSDYAHYRPYRNICPITGWSEAKVTRAGHNLGSWTNKCLVGNATNGYKIDNGGSSLIARVKPNTSYVASRKSGQGDRFRIVGFVNEPSSTASMNTEQLYSNNSTNTYTFNSGKYNFIVFTYESSSSIAQDTAESMIKLATDTNTTYEPYEGEVYTIDLDGTRYGGTLDVISGVLTVISAIIDLGDLTWTLDSGRAGHFYTSAISGIKNEGYGLCTAYEVDNEGANTTKNGIISLVQSYGSGRIFAVNTDYTDGGDFKTSVTGQKLVYELATPQTITLTPTEVELLLGYNTLWADTGDISLTYDPETIGNISESIGDLWAAISALEARVTELET